MKRHSLFIICTLLAVAVSCRKKPTIANDDELARDALYSVMQISYLWNTLMPEVKREDYPDPYKLLEAMRYKELDRWSYVQDYGQWQQQSQAIFVGHGIMLGLDANGRARIAQIYNQSQLYAKGVRRGWIVKTLNGTDLAPVLDDPEAYSSLMGASQAGITNTFVFETPEGNSIEIADTKATFRANTVIHYDTLKLKSGTAGYLVFEQFENPSETELERTFAFFSQSNINSIIVDLRYNGGGRLNVLQKLATHIAGSSYAGKPFLTMTYNEQQKKRNETMPFSAVTASVGVGKMVVITTRGTASASEDLINGLKPFMEIKTVGDTTNGKPVGMIGTTFSTKSKGYIYMFWPITFTLFNTDGESDFYEGFAPDKYAIDDITRDWGDRNETCLREAIYILENGSVSPKGGQGGRQPAILSEGTRQSNAYLIAK
ncbi:MAG: hypothetical protein LBV26_07480 [Bacteroidales bacterium]|jgi:C-terminal processing protease CtpA/Prc|nr:hypothetical protein [Bacteroidales bacterium]